MNNEIKTFETGKLYRMDGSGLPFILHKKGERRDFIRGGFFMGSSFIVKYEGVDYFTKCDIYYDADGEEYLILNIESDYGKSDDVYNWFGNTVIYACDMYVGECSEEEWENL